MFKKENAESTEEVPFSPGQLQEFMKTVLEATAKDNREMFLEAIKELKKPTPEQEEQLKQQKMIRERKAQLMILLAKDEEKGKRNRRDRCSHTKPNGKIAIGGQIHADGLVHPLCVKCQTEFQPFKPTAEMMRSGVSLMNRGLTPDFFKFKEPTPRPEPEVTV
jgi:hypothetical protein